MAKTTTLKERGTGAVIYPQTIPSQVIFPDGTDLNDALESQSNVTGVPTEKRIEAIEPTLVTDALRKVPQSLTPEEQAQVKENLGISKKELFIDMWRAVYPRTQEQKWIDYNEETDKFFITPTFRGHKIGFDDITYEEALKIYCRLGVSAYMETPYISGALRINLPPFNYWNPFSIDDPLHNSFYMEYLILGLSDTSYVGGCKSMQRNLALKGILGTIVVYASNKNFIMSECPELRYVAFSFQGNAAITVNLADSPLLDISCFLLTLSQTNSTTYPSATITVHPNVYAKLTGDTTNAAAAALTEDELAQWMQIVTDAAAKKITFITTT